MRGRPACLATDSVGCRDQHWRIARPPEREFEGDGPPPDALDRGDHLHHGMAEPVAEIIGCAAGLELVEHAQMCVRQIGYVHVVAYTGAVRCRVVAAEHLYRRAPTEGGVDDERNEVCLRAMVLAKPAGRISAGCVEI